MSGVEVVASIIGIVQFVPEVAKTIFKVYELWEQVKDAPANIHHHFETLKTYQDVFSLIEMELGNDVSPENTPRGRLMRQVLNMATKAQSELFHLVEDLQRQVDTKKGFKKKLSSSRFVIKQSTIRRLEKRLQDANDALKLALMAYNASRPELNLERWSDVIAAKVLLKLQESELLRVAMHNSVQEDEGPTEKPDAECTTIAKAKHATMPYKYSGSGQFGSTHATLNVAWKTQIQLPKWLSNRVYELQSIPVSSGWTCSFQVYNIIDDKHEIVQRIKKGDKWGVIEMLVSRKASIFDRDKQGTGLLLYAAENHQVEICEALLHMGLRHVLDDPGLGQAALKYISSDLEDRRPHHVVDSRTREIEKLFKNFIQDPNFFIPCDRPLDFVAEFMYGDESLKIFLRHWLPYYYDMPTIERAENVRLAAFTVMDGKTLNTLLVPNRHITSCDVKQSTDAKQSVIHSAAVAIGSRLAYDFLGGRQSEFDYPKFTDDWCKFARDVASVADARDLHCIETVIPPAIFQVPVWRGTPLTSLIGGAFCLISTGELLKDWDGALHECLECWLQELQFAGIDLLAYGKREASILHDPREGTKGAFDANAIERSKSMQRKTDVKCASQVSRSNASMRRHPDYVDYFAIRIMDIQFGAKPCDWKIMWVYEYEHLAFQFWENIERSGNVEMPGSWVE